MGNTHKFKGEEEYERLRAHLHQVPWILNGSVMKIAPRSTSPKAHTTYTWTRKVRGKTVTVALSREQYQAFQKAIKANQQLEKNLRQMRKMSEAALLSSFPGVQRKPRV